MCVFVQIRKRVSTFNKAELTKLIGERWVGSDVLGRNVRTFEEKRDSKRVVCVCGIEKISVYLKKWSRHGLNESCVIWCTVHVSL